MEKVGLHPLVLPNALVSPGEAAYDTQAALDRALKAWPEKARPAFWSQGAEKLWSAYRRDPCNMCGYCGEFLCWGRSGPKSSTRFTFLRELVNVRDAEVRTDAQAYEVTYNSQTRRATGVRYLDLSDPDWPKSQFLPARNVIISCGAIQSARLLLMSGPPGGLGNRFDQVGRNISFHLFGMGAKAVLPPKFQGRLHSEYGHTGNITSYDYYLVKDDRKDAPKNLKGKWCKAGTLASAAKKNPLENADLLLLNTRVPRETRIGVDLLRSIELYTRTVELRVTGDDLPMPRNRVDLDPTYVDQHGLPVARITRDYGDHENWMFAVLKEKLDNIFEPYYQAGVLRRPGKQPTPDDDVKFSGGLVDLIGDHQFGSCRMGEDPATSVVDPFCRLHDIPNVFVVDSSVMPTGFGLNPMMTVVANALRVGTWIIEQSQKGGL
jgi:choline dehydrogenase-like flavoprotein